MEFISGAKYIRADFHLHTKSDTEFNYKSEENDFVKNYVQKLIEENIQLAVITNHNKFDLKQYDGLRKKAKKKGIFLLPGIELNINEGKTGLHTLIVFDNKKWLVGNEDFINDFITKTAPTDNHDFKYKNGLSQHSLIQTIELLNTFKKKYFIVLAHVSSDNGLLKEVNGKKIEQLGKDPIFRKNVLGFQAVKNGDFDNLKLWLKKKLPAFVEGSDPKSIEQIGKGKKCYLKLSDLNFDAVKFALQYHESRVVREIPKQQNAYIKSVEYVGGKLDGKIIHLSPSMNNIIGIRGSGKSSILETIRYALNINLDKKITADENYKNSIINKTLGGGGKILLKIQNNNNIYNIEKGTTGIARCIEKPDLNIKSLIKSFYFGQKDLSRIGETKQSNKEFIYRIIGKIDNDQKLKSDEISNKIRALLSKIIQIEKKIEIIPDIKTQIADLKQDIENIEKFGLKEKLEKEINFSQDINKIKYIKKEIKITINNFEEFLDNQNEDYNYLKAYKSKENKPFFNEIFTILDNISIIQNSFKEKKLEIENKFSKVESIENKLLELIEKLNEVFAKSQRESSISAEDIKNYQEFQTKLSNKKLLLTELEKLIPKKKLLRKELKTKLNEVKESWQEEFNIIKSKIDTVNSKQKKLKIIIKFKQNKRAIEDFIFNFSHNIRRENIKMLIKNNNDLIDLFEKFENKSDLKINQIDDIKNQFYKNLPNFLTFRVPDTFEIEYNRKPLKNHSLGQRASALIVFLFSLRNNDLILIDQPEDDLDSQTVYNEVITLIKNMKSSTQFIFATHNPNIPVLGDCEQVLACDYDNKNEKININSGGIDKKIIQQKIINIMEGGEQAFDERKNKYTQWNH